MPAEAPPGILPLFLRGVTCEKFGIKTGEGINDLVEYKLIPMEDILKEITVMGVMSDFQPGQKQITSYTGEEILLVVDKTQEYGERFLFIYTEEAKQEYMNKELEKEAAIKEQAEEEARVEEARKVAEYARLNVVFEDKPVISRLWQSETMADTDNEIGLLSDKPSREPIMLEISRPTRFIKGNFKFSDKNADSSGYTEFRAYKDPNFKAIRDSELGIQVASSCADADAQTSWYRLVSKSVQCESASTSTETDNNDHLLAFLEVATIQVENALQQNESVDIFNETFRLLGFDEANEGAQIDNELREIKNFADPTYSKFKALSAIDWMPQANGMVAVSAVRNISFDTRVPTIGQTYTSHLMLWDFRLLVKPLILMQSNYEIFTFRFNRTNKYQLVGGCITGQVILWELEDSMKAAVRKNNRKTSVDADQDEDDFTALPVVPKYVSSVDHSHKKCVADLFWLPPTTQINFRGQLVADEFLDNECYQFITVAGDGLIMVWDTRFEQIMNDELRHIGRSKHVPVDSSSKKEGAVKPLWAPIFKAHLKKLEGVGELSLCKVSEVANHMGSPFAPSLPNLNTDSRTQFVISTEEGNMVFADLSTTTGLGDDDDDESELSCVKWVATDHPRPSVCLQESPFLPGIFLSVSDWSFHLWKVGEEKPVFASPLSTTYLTAGAWSISRPAVIYVACSDGQILVWDFTDSSFNPSISLKATHSKITSMEFLPKSNPSSSRQQLLAVGDEIGTLHIFEIPRNLSKATHNEAGVMVKFVERELQRNSSPEGEVQSGEGEGEDGDMMGGMVEEVDNGGSIGLDGSTANGTAEEAKDALKAAQRELIKKEEEEFLKLEAIFLEELKLIEATSDA